MRSIVWAQIQHDWYSYMKRRLEHAQREDHVKKRAIY